MAPDLGSELKLYTAAAARIICNVLSKDSDQQTCRISRLQQHIGSLEEEKRKIEVFKRELPLSMYLLDDVILACKEELEQWKKENMQQLTTMEVKVDEEEEEIEMKLEIKDSKEKMNWMSTAQLWTNNHNDTTKINNMSGAESKGMLENPETKKKVAAAGGGTFVRKDDGRSLDLSLVPAAVGDDARWPGPEPTASRHVSLRSSSSQQQQAQRKARRCWSPELHRRFVAALQQLGGAQVATPKQIRELMKVDGLTNDEVKSHLQKYRINTRGMPTGGARSHGVAVVAMGGLWAEPESHSSSGGSPQGPLQLSGSTRTISVTAGESCEDDSRSEGYNWR